MEKSLARNRFKLTAEQYVYQWVNVKFVYVLHLFRIISPSCHTLAHTQT